MKKYITLFLCIWLGYFFLTSCEKYLDKAPAAGIAENDIFTKYANFLNYFRANYDGTYASNNIVSNIKCAGYPMFWWVMGGSQFTWETITDNALQGIEDMSSIRQGLMGGSISRWYIYHVNGNGGNWQAIRRCNICLKNINKLEDATEEDKNDIIAQAHLVRAFAHLTLCKWWGGMPYITKVLEATDNLDIARLSVNETLRMCAADCDTAVTYYEKAGRMRRDPGPGQVGHLNHPDMDYPNGVAAKALKSRLLLWAASPKNNVRGVVEWEEAAKASWEALQTALQYNYSLVSIDEYNNNFVNVAYTNEKLWGSNYGGMRYTYLRAVQPGPLSGSAYNSWGECPTQNCVDKFETKWGDPLYTQTDRDAAIALGHYNEQDPYANRDPRFYKDIMYNQAPIPGFVKADIWYQNVGGVISYGDLVSRNFQGITITGYYSRKIWGGQSIRNQTQPIYSDCVIRLGELYLNYAEAANEAYGPNTPAPGATMTAVQAINIIRTRAGMPDVKAEFTVSKDSFRPKIKSERNVEMLFEGAYYFDLRRWMDAPAVYATGTEGMDVEKVTVSATYPTGFKYTRFRIPEISQTKWFDYMYYLPFSGNDNYKTKNFIPNEIW